VTIQQGSTAAELCKNITDNYRRRVRISQGVPITGDVHNRFANHTNSGGWKISVALFEPGETTWNRPNPGLDRFRACEHGDRWRIEHQPRPLTIRRHRILRREDGGCQRGTVQTWVGVVKEKLGSCVRSSYPRGLGVGRDLGSGNVVLGHRV